MTLLVSFIQNFNFGTNMRNLAMIGGGQMGRALASGMIAAEVLPADQITVVDTDPRSVAWWQEHQPQVRAVSSLADVDGSQHCHEFHLGLPRLQARL